MSDERKFLTVGQVVRGGGPPMELDEALKRMDQAAERWAKRFEEEPWLNDVFPQNRDSCDPQDDE